MIGLGGHWLFHAGGGVLPGHEDLMLLWPIVLLLLIGSIVTVTVLARRGVLGDADRPISIDLGMAAIAAGLSFGAAAIHFAVIEEHITEGLEFAAFFLVTGWFQMVWPLAYFLRRTDSIALAGLFVNLAICGVWLMSRTVGMPFGANPWVPEPIGFLDILATVFEIGIVGLLLPVALPDKTDLPRRTVPLKDALILGGFAMSFVALISAYALLLPVAVGD